MPDQTDDTHAGQTGGPAADDAGSGTTHATAAQDGAASAPPALTLRVPGLPIVEGGAFEVVVERAPSDQASSADLAFREDIATFLGLADPEDFVGGFAPRPVAFAPGETSKSVLLQTADDGASEIDEVFALGLTNLANAAFDNDRVDAGGILLDNDKLPTASIAAATPALAEGDTGATPFRFDLTRTGGGESLLPTVVRLAVEPGAAGGDPAEADDLIGGFREVVVEFAPGETVRTLEVGALGDPAPEPDEGFTVRIVSAEAAVPLEGVENFRPSPIGVGAASATILDDDARGPGGVALTEGPDLASFARSPEAVEVRALGGGDLVAGSRFGDRLDGGDGPDLLLGRGGDDTVLGGADGDRLLGGPGSDLLDGGGGSDLLLGGAGADVFRFSVPDPAGLGPAVIADFSRAEGDRIDLSAIGDTDPYAPGEQGIHFVGDVTGPPRPPVYVPGEITFVQGGGVTSVAVNTGGGVLAIRLAGLVDLVSDDFVL